MKHTNQMLCRILCSFNSCKFIPYSILLPTYHQPLKMNACSGSTSKVMCEKDRVFPPIYVLSTIPDISSAIKTLSEEICCRLVIKNIDPPVDSEILSHSSVEQLADANIVVIDAKLLAHNYKKIPKLKWAHCTFAGIEPLFEIMNEKPKFIITRHGENKFSEQIAEYVMGQVIIQEKNFRGLWAAQMEKSWAKMEECINCISNRHLEELTIGVLGVGNIGQGIAMFFKPHGTKVIGLSKRIRKPGEFGLFDKIESSLVDVLAVSDYIVNALPSTPETVGLLNGDVLKKCTKMPVFINVGRGNIINEDSLVKALENNWLRHAVLDVFEKEPLPTDSKLWNLIDKVTITPHFGAISLPKYIAKDFLSSLLCYQQSKPLRNVVDWERGY